jgi:hypothetical protein
MEGSEMDQIGLEELAQRLAMLEGSAAQQQESQMRGQFMDKYGTKFSGDEGIGIAILNELNRRGIDTSAADEAVQDILDTIRAEATAVLDKIKMDERTVSDLMDKVSTVEESIAAVTGATPGADVAVGTSPPPPEDIASDLAPPPPEGDMGAMGGEMPPPEGDMGAMGGEMPPPEEGAPPEEVPMPEAAGMPPEEALPPEIPSDRRVKSVIRSRINTRPKVWRPTASMLSGVRSEL